MEEEIKRDTNKGYTHVQAIEIRHFFTGFLLFALSWLGLTQPARAQFECEIKLAANPTSDSQNLFRAIACKGDNCTAGLLKLNNSLDGRVGLYRSRDGGKSWVMQDAGLTGQWASDPHIRAICQIDSLNIVAVGDTALVLRTYNGGDTWERQTVPGPADLIRLTDVSFANPNEGIAVGADSGRVIFTTTNGGKKWVAAPFSVLSGWQCHAYGNGKFRIFKYGSGEIYTTTDNWHSVDSTKPIYDLHLQPHNFQHVVGSCFFSDGDLIIAGGSINHVAHTTAPLLVRSIDGGHSWTEVLADTLMDQGSVTYMSDVDHDTIVAGCSAAGPNVLWSIDRGRTWKVDSLFPDLTKVAFSCTGIALNAHRDLIGAFGAFTSSSLLVGRLVTAGVETYAHIGYYSYLCPNPATQELSIISQDRVRPIRVFDILGREVLSGMLDANGKCQLNVSSLAPAIYVVMLDHDGRMLPVSRVLVTH